MSLVIIILLVIISMGVTLYMVSRMVMASLGHSELTILLLIIMLSPGVILVSNNHGFTGPQ